MIVQDRFSSWLQGDASPAKSAHDTKIGPRRFVRPKLNAARTYTDGASAEEDLTQGADPSYAYTDGSKEFKKAL